MNNRGLWIALVIVMGGSFAVLGYYGKEIYRQAPPIPERVVTTEGDVLFTEQDIRDGPRLYFDVAALLTEFGQTGIIWILRPI